MNCIKYLSLPILLCLLLPSCKDDTMESPRPDKDRADGYTQKVNNFISDNMNYFYFWNNQIPQYDLKNERNPFDYFNKIIYAQDPWSFLVDDATLLDDEYNNIQYTYGLNLDLVYRDEDLNSNRIIGFIQYTDPNTPAADAQLQRGEIITAINGEVLTDQNYESLLTGESIKATFSEYRNDRFVDTKTVYLKPAEVRINPVNTTTIVDRIEHRIGYLFYTGYAPTYNQTLKQVFADFRTQGITDLVLDLRYNPGGYDEALTYLCSCIAPASAVKDKKVIVRDRYNENLQKEFDEANEDPAISFIDTVPNLNLQRVFILTSGNTYSASEATIIGLMPYMEVVLIGEQTGGKYATAWVLQPWVQSGREMILDPEISHWAIQAIVARFENANGLTFNQGINPDYSVGNISYDMKALGDPSEVMFAKAIQQITGQDQPTELRSMAAVKQLRFFTGHNSPRDHFKKVLIRNKMQGKTK